MLIKLYHGSKIENIRMLNTKYSNYNGKLFFTPIKDYARCYGSVYFTYFNIPIKEFLNIKGIMKYYNTKDEYKHIKELNSIIEFVIEFNIEVYRCK